MANKKPWSREECRRLYVMGKRIGVRGLAELSGQSKNAIERWCKAENWPEQRRQYQAKLQARTEEKSIEAVSEKFSLELVELALSHLNDYEESAKWARLYFQAMNERVEGIKSKDEQREFLTAINPAHLEKMSTILDRAIKGQRVAAGLEYEDLNKAIRKVQAAGYRVTEPTEISLNALTCNGKTHDT